MHQLCSVLYYFALVTRRTVGIPTILCGLLWRVGYIVPTRTERRRVHERDTLYSEPHTLQLGCMYTCSDRFSRLQHVH